MYTVFFACVNVSSVYQSRSLKNFRENIKLFGNSVDKLNSNESKSCA